jgi:hypothetical protein
LGAGDIKSSRPARGTLTAFLVATQQAFGDIAAAFTALAESETLSLGAAHDARA